MKLITEISKKERLFILNFCIKNRSRLYHDRSQEVKLPDFLYFVFGCIKNVDHKKSIIFYVGDILEGNISFIQDCDKCQSKMNLIEVR